MEFFVVILTLLAVGVGFKWRHELAHWLKSKPVKSGLQYEIDVLRCYGIEDRIDRIVKKEYEKELDTQQLAIEIRLMKKRVEDELKTANNKIDKVETGK